MNASPDPISSCRHCRHYSPEGRRGGQCGQLDALVHGDWKACPLALPAFVPSWESFRSLGVSMIAGEVRSMAVQQTATGDQVGATPVLASMARGQALVAVVPDGAASVSAVSAVSTTSA